MENKNEHMFWKRKYKGGQFALFAVNSFDSTFRWDVVSKEWQASNPFATPGLGNRDTAIDEQQLAELQLQLVMETHLT